ncbi:WXG100 family type VII secretion target [Pseudonocardia sp. NPDC049635]|uniref:WXG100 family type VII secretion target n=1 Tax=Pseudonocardia sp. NPDC049635 TaxID=3155506 RepID=UPI0033E9A6C2
MGSEIRVTFAAIDQAAADIDGASARITGQLGDLRQYLSPVVAGWTGDAAGRYNEAQQRWDRSATDLTATLQRIRTLVSTAGQSYQDVERRNAGRFGV